MLSWEPGIFSKQAMSPSSSLTQGIPAPRRSGYFLHVICQISNQWERHVSLREKQTDSDFPKQCLESHLHQRNGTHNYRHNVIRFSTRKLFPSIQYAVNWSQITYSYSTLIMWKTRETALVFSSLSPQMTKQQASSEFSIHMPFWMSVDKDTFVQPECFFKYENDSGRNGICKIIWLKMADIFVFAKANSKASILCKGNRLTVNNIFALYA